jgi:hypothetical protein
MTGPNQTATYHTNSGFTADGRQLSAVDIYTGSERVPLGDVGREWIFGTPAVSPDETWVAIPCSSAHPEVLVNRRMSAPYVDFPDHRLRLVRVAMDAFDGCSEPGDDPRRRRHRHSRASRG